MRRFPRLVTAAAAAASLLACVTVERPPSDPTQAPADSGCAERCKREHGTCGRSCSLELASCPQRCQMEASSVAGIPPAMMDPTREIECEATCEHSASVCQDSCTAVEASCNTECALPK
jgi:hypothetical protein